MNRLPRGWIEAAVCEVTEPFSTIDPRKEPNREFRYIDIGCIDNSRNVVGEPKRFSGNAAPSRARRVVQRGDVLFSTVRTYLRNIAQVPDELDGSLTSTGIAILRPSEAVNGRYLFRWVCGASFIEAMSTAQDGTMYPAVTDSDVSAGRIPLAPLAEQKRIVNRLDRLLERTESSRDELNRIPLLIERYKWAILEQAFTGALTADWRMTHRDLMPVAGRKGNETKKRYRHDAADGFEPPYEIPETWRWLSLPQLGTLDRGRSRHRPRNDPRLFGGLYPFIQTGEVRAADRYLTAFSQTYSEEGLAQSRLWPPGTVCITIAANIAETAILGMDACFPDSVVGFVADRERTNPDYVEFFVRTVRSALQAFAPATAQKNINLDTLSSVRVPVAPIDEQDEIVRRLDAAMDLMGVVSSDVDRAANLLEHLEQGCLASAFRGELVPQDPNDEPAQNLLKRIRTSRAVELKTERRRAAA